MCEKPQLRILEVLPGLTQLNALVKNIMAQTGASDPIEAIRLVNSREWIVVPREQKWLERDGVIYFSVTSDGKSGEEPIEYLESKKLGVGKYAKSVLRHPDFKPTKSGTVHHIAVLKGMLFADDVRITSNIRNEAERRNLTKPNAEIACLIRAKFTDKEIEAMGLWAIVAMHDPIEVSAGGLHLLGANRSASDYSVNAFRGNPGDRWTREDGFAFSVEQVVSP